MKPIQSFGCFLCLHFLHLVDFHMNQFLRTLEQGHELLGRPPGPLAQPAVYRKQHGVGKEACVEGLDRLRLHAALTGHRVDLAALRQKEFLHRIE